jgi:hypothetical protein
LSRLQLGSEFQKQPHRRFPVTLSGKLVKLQNFTSGETQWTNEAFASNQNDELIPENYGRSVIILV